MTTTDPSLDISLSEDGTLLVVGDVDLGSAPILGAELAARVREATDRLVVDLSKVAFMDSSGLRLLLESDEACEARRVQLVIRNPSRAVLHLLEITGLTTELSIDQTPG